MPHNSMLPASVSAAARPRRAFTLIELLVVVSVIAILAAIALPNFLEAQVRAKTSRVKSDLRTLATGLESFTVDNNQPPFDGDPDTAHWGWATSLRALTTPITYLSSLPRDVFQDDTMADAVPAPGTTFMLDNNTRGNHSYDYSSSSWAKVGMDPGSTDRWQTSFGESRWKIGSCGPDRIFFVNNDQNYGFQSVYDPTNGTVSLGDIYRSQARTP